MNDEVVGFGVGVATAAAAHQVASVLVLVVLIGTFGTALVWRDFRMVIGVVEGIAFDARSVVLAAEKLETAVFVSGGEDERPQALIDQLVFVDADGSQLSDSVVATVILIDPYAQVGLRMRNGQLLMVNNEANLLVRLVRVDVGVAVHFGCYADHRFADRETGG